MLRIQEDIQIDNASDRPCLLDRVKLESPCLEPGLRAVSASAARVIIRDSSFDVEHNRRKELVMHKKRRVHDAIVGVAITVGVALGIWVNPMWLWIPGIIGVLMIQSGFTGFCPVYFTLDKLEIGESASSSGSA